MIRFLTGLVFMAALGGDVALAGPPGLMERVFFYNDIYNFVGKPYPSPDFGRVRAVVQPFVSNCSNLNRVTIPFYVKDDARKGTLTFNLYQTGPGTKPLFSTAVDVGQFPSSAKIGTHYLAGVIHSIWFPPQPLSKKQNYFWELRADPDRPASGVGIYLTRPANAQLEPVSIDGVKGSAYGAFYSYCQFRFEWNRILSESGERLWREKYFLSFYLVLLGGVGAYFKKYAGK
ncbi:MAG: hypothetical protein HY579_14115 [Nitrospinae bacterium]|nr:hypothetical protein [Nitrospinota bacterium]